MSSEAFQPTEEWPLQENYKRQLHERIQKWGERVSPMFEKFEGDNFDSRVEFFEFLMTSVERGDRLTAFAIESADGYVRNYIEGPGMYGRGGGSIDSTAGVAMCQQSFEALYTIYLVGQEVANSAS